MTDRVLHEGRFLRLVSRGGWEFVERTNAQGVVVVIAVTDAGELVLIEQERRPVGAPVIELPAGLSGDDPGAHGEELTHAARRELLEETGYEADALELVTRGPTSAGLTSEVITVFFARGVRRVGDGGGVEGEAITIHHVPLPEVPAWLDAAQARGALVDPKVYAALWFAGR
ncbi:MAG: NUDIX hydrolase [Planctomycetes bacterium]|nr:NUDIX hydrolase [Planctomycetota bacterium]